ncbi:IS66 family insertion sequence element accessory protein TnpB [Bradyrhizobium australafricanum]|uniref:IS66 family insertion sequence element accessory protein TnpB n=1 Tax=Bradyrhizobium australafricanum TaxID=2821406 RepID=UPI0035D7F130
MIGLRAGLSIWIATQPVDFRRGMDSLAMLVSEAFGADPFDGGLYIFRSKRRDRVKILTWDGSGLVLYYKRIEAVHLAADQGRRHAAISCSALGAARWLRLEACADAGCGSASTSWLIRIKSRSSLMRSCCRITLHE